MPCDCKVIKNGNDIDEEINKYVCNKKFTFFEKLKVIYSFIEFYFYFVTSSVINFMVNDVLEPKIPKRLLKKML